LESEKAVFLVRYQVGKKSLYLLLAPLSSSPQLSLRRVTSVAISLMILGEEMDVVKTIPFSCL
jgi:hypothetical protein